ncbi:unnamed protein product [Microthlaspi erraticum]|uniref:Jacalin-type lectin domain-containing protein n=1 Tax=Microthlaspi erraticum TaxID=1685480 RepID=A0A6D2HYC3_9BRAS|nr:unnamed protein product [Microthlaspi erraticum]
MSWDDGSHVKVKRVQLTYDDDAINSIQVTYDGTLQSQLRGSVGSKSAEYITSLTAYRRTLTVITALTFTTNKSSYGPYGNKSEITAISVFGETGGTRETEWDDGSDHDGVTKIYVRSDATGIQLVKFDYVKDGKPKLGALHGVHGNSRGSTREFAINHPEEYLVSVEGWCDSSTVIMGIQFKTNHKTYEHMGYDFHGDDTKFDLQVQDKKIIGFHGFATNRLTSIGAYFVPLASTAPSVPPSPIAKKLQGEGEDGGTPWDDGAFDGVRKVHVGQFDIGIAAVKFVYDKDAAEIVGDEHGKRTLAGNDVFVLDYPSEYIIEVKGTYEKVIGSKAMVISMLKFTTNKNRTSEQFGIESGKAFTLGEKDHKIVGFHGSAEKLLHKLGVYVLPITK